MATIEFVGLGDMSGPIAASLVASTQHRLRSFAEQRTVLTALRRAR